ncbi:MAG: efflux RND transporter periplasmic adaptor subunit [Myxococcales bacterium]|nr:efflux RND transporter periplasmic adaptor subunit [Myxococcales bacterium]
MTDAEQVQREGESQAGTNAPPAPDEEVQQRLQGQKGRGRWWKRGALAAVIALVIGGVVVSQQSGDDEGPRYQSGHVVRGELAVTVAATGRLEAREMVDVGAEVSGRLLEVLVDHNDHVKAGQVLATIDTKRLDARAREASGQVRLARAELEGARAEAALRLEERDRVQTLAGRGLASEQALETAVAEARRAEAAVEMAKARASMAHAGLDAARDDVARAQIVAPIDGIVLARNVEPGQTLASSFQVPVLFQIARDLRELRLHVRVDEADVARVREGQTATFTVEAHPGRKFPSRVVSLRNVPSIEQGVVSYEAVLAVQNEEGLLRPGMTATATIVTERVSDALLVPNAALRFLPLEQAKDDATQEESRGSRVSKDDEPRHRVWKLGEQGPEAVALSIGRSDGEQTEVLSGEIEVGMALLVDVEEAKP